MDIMDTIDPSWGEDDSGPRSTRMTVGELIRILENYPKEMGICGYNIGEPDAYDVSVTEGDVDGGLWVDVLTDGVLTGNEKRVVCLVMEQS